MPRWSANSNGGFAAGQTVPSSTGLRRCWSELCEVNSTTGRTSQDLGLRSSSSLISSPDQSIAAPRGHSRKIGRLSLWRLKERDRPLRDPRDAVGEDFFHAALGSFGGIGQLGGGGQICRGTRGSGTAGTAQDIGAFGGAGPRTSRYHCPLRSAPSSQRRPGAAINCRRTGLPRQRPTDTHAFAAALTAAAEQNVQALRWISSIL